METYSEGSKETRLNVRINSEQKAVIERAAKLRHTTLSHFVIEHAFEAARQLIAEETHLKLSKKQMKHFLEMLDTPPAKNLKAMRALLNNPGILG